MVALGTTVTRALEHAASDGGALRPGAGLATQRIGPHTRLKIVDAIISGAHEPGESHYELLRAFADGAVLRRMSSTLQYYAYRSHEFGDSVLITRQRDKVLKGRRSSRRTRVWRGWGWRECGASGPGDLAAQHVLQHVDPPHTVERRRRLPHAVSSVSSLCARPPAHRGASSSSTSCCIICKLAVRQAAPLHDLGKIAIPDAMNRPRTPGRRAVMLASRRTGRRSRTRRVNSTITPTPHQQRVRERDRNTRPDVGRAGSECKA